MLVAALLVLLLALGRAHDADSFDVAAGPFKQVLLPQSVASATGAVCLDGTPPAMYVDLNTTSRKWILFMQGGAWCHTPEECLARSKTPLGSTSGMPTSGPVSWEVSALMSRNTTENPYFSTWNYAYFTYCDGASFSGDVAEPVLVNSTKVRSLFVGAVARSLTTTQLYFRGHRVLTQLVTLLLDAHGLNIATDVLLSGCSAGGLATYLHADYVATLLPPGVNFKAAPFSGFFLDTPNDQGVAVYGPQLRSAFALHNCSGGVNSRCVAANVGHEDECVSHRAHCVPFHVFPPAAFSPSTRIHSSLRPSLSPTPW